ncbi:LacI family DNA-binding transcriptional regulator [Peterkaempfera sp. SMS 1(5)a]|uniref:LacI family DNA-binding transcriptional regulator n=1 Tax=Peterkaempfera podocarpi TaxID=3232308 RepID=UPI00366C3531
MSTTNRPRRVTIDDVARSTGVSRQTVSRAINDKPEIDPATRQRILSVAQEMGYRPSRFARGMVRQSTTTLGLVIADVLNPFFPEVVAGVLEAADARGWQVVIYTTASQGKGAGGRGDRRGPCGRLRGVHARPDGHRPGGRIRHPLRPAGQ